MTTTDTDALTERLRERLIETFAQQDPRPEFATVKALKIAHMVAPIVAEEVRKAKAEALREAAPLMHDHHDAAWLETQAIEHEAGDSDERR